MRILSVFVLLVVAAVPAAMQGGTVTFSGVGAPSGSTHSVDVSATFKNVGSNLEIDVFNNATGTDPLQILSGLLWNVNGSAPSGTSLSSAVTGSGSDLYTSGSSGTPNAELRNSVLGGGNGWQYLAPPGPLNSVSFQYGFGCSGLGGTFGGLGNASYGAIGPSSDIGHVPLSNQLPLVMSTSASASEADFVISGFNVDVSNIKNVTFAFGSAGTNNIIGGIPIPEPSTFLLAALGLFALFVRSPKRA